MSQVHEHQVSTGEVSPTPRGGLSALSMEQWFLGPAMDGRVLNLEQFNDTPERDSVLEHLRHEVQQGNQVAALALVDEAIRLNGLEGERLRDIAGHADETAAALRNNRGPAVQVSLRSVVRQLTGPLGRLLADRADSDAENRVRDLIAVVPGSMLRSKTLHHQLGKRKTAKLEEFLGGQA